VVRYKTTGPDVIADPRPKVEKDTGINVAQFVQVRRVDVLAGQQDRLCFGVCGVRVVLLQGVLASTWRSLCRNGVLTLLAGHAVSWDLRCAAAGCSGINLARFVQVPC
jgi:hypothetical protein